MIALSRQMQEHDPSEIELLLPWYAVGTLDPNDIKRVEEALARDPAIARQYAAIQREYAETIALNETLGAPSMRAMQRLFAAIDAEPAQAATVSRGAGRRLLDFLGGLSPRALAWSASFGILLVLVQAGIIATVLMRSQPASYQTASFDNSRARLAQAPINAPVSAEPLTRALGPQSAAAPVHVLVRFAPDARISDITALLNNYQASIIDGAKGGMFTLQLGAMSKDDADGLIARLKREKIVSLAAAAP